MTNSAEIFAALDDAKLTNRKGSPLRAILGGMPPQVIEAAPKWAYMEAAAGMGIDAAWQTAVDATVAALVAAKDPNPKRIAVWWHSDKSSRISTLEPEWRAICDRVVWAGKTEAQLIEKARAIAAAN